MNKKILLLTLVHPDFLPPVYAVAQVLRDLEFDIHILTFDSFHTESFELGENIVLETLGKHYDATTFERLKFRNRFTKRAMELVAEGPIGIISFCPFSFQCGLKIKKDTPLIYIALEIADFILPSFLKSPLSNYRNLEAIKNMAKADLLATPSIQRSAWLAGRCHLDFLPYTILNTAYLKEEEENYDELFKKLVPPEISDKKIVLYTGAISPDQCILELVRAFELVNDPDSALIIAGLRDNEYCNDLQELVQKCKSVDRIKLFHYMPRNQIFALQSNAHIGVCMLKEYQNKVKSKMMAPNKVGEYLSKKLHILGIMTEYLRPFKQMGFASLSDSSTPREISKALKESLIEVNKKDYKEKIETFVREYYCMQQQLQPVVRYLNEIVSLV